MATSAEERAALLAKIRADMEASRNKIQELKEQKASRGSIFVTATPTAISSGSNPSLSSLLTAPVDLTSNEKASNPPVNVSQENSVLNSPKNNSNTTNVTVTTPSNDIIPENPPDHVNEEEKNEIKSNTPLSTLQTPAATLPKQEPTPTVTPSNPEPQPPKETAALANPTTPSSPTTSSLSPSAEGFNKIFLVRKKDGTEEKILAKELPDGSLISAQGKVLRVSTKDRSASVTAPAEPPKEKERSPSVAEGSPELRSNPGGRFLVKDRTNSIANRNERAPPIANRNERTPSIANRGEKPAVDIGFSFFFLLSSSFPFV